MLDNCINVTKSTVVKLKNIIPSKVRRCSSERLGYFRFNFIAKYGFEIEMSRRFKGFYGDSFAFVTVEDPIAISQRKCQLERFHSAQARG